MAKEQKATIEYIDPNIIELANQISSEIIAKESARIESDPENQKPEVITTRISVAQKCIEIGRDCAGIIPFSPEDKMLTKCVNASITAYNNALEEAQVQEVGGFGSR